MLSQPDSVLNDSVHADQMLELMYNLPAQGKLRDFLVTVEMVRSREINWNLLEKAG